MKNTGLIYAGAALAGLLIIRSILKGTGIISAEAPPVTWDTTKPPVRNNVTCKSSYTRAQIQTGLFSKWARQIYDAKGIFNDNESAVYDVIINKIRTRGDMYLLGQYFAMQHQGEIMQYLRSFLSAEELDPIIKKINSLPCNI